MKFAALEFERVFIIRHEPTDGTAGQISSVGECWDLGLIIRIMIDRAPSLFYRMYRSVVSRACAIDTTRRRMIHHIFGSRVDEYCTATFGSRFIALR